MPQIEHVEVVAGGFPPLVGRFIEAVIYVVTIQQKADGTYEPGNKHYLLDFSLDDLMTLTVAMIGKSDVKIKELGSGKNGHRYVYFDDTVKVDSLGEETFIPAKIDRT
ncbi:MAG: hypothetical protein JNJ77_16230 [Planctomycetia bacterium]|nr:hypothetical protein [Planctomycetia bacterium]